ncbi:hypothetical protein A6F68_02688 [Tsuneonella dongtanensis]|uniref:Uncharacterized protein n=1 Tax=Tsuneonella dongtanensis TaxID=692370 RepID=A0A1B2AGA7_9SPHN|nr:hypothetical protein [Tsuneonella dongtanensis]ANY21180.1 hypothetical protein A6F68_02688 [Tsuneonella dongtanensis]
MRLATITFALAATALATPALANHILNLDTPYASRGACEAAVAQFSAEDREMLLDRFPTFFHRNGDVASFLTRAFTCEFESAEQAWFIHDHRGEILASEWFQRKP